MRIQSRICFFKKNDEPNAPNTQQIARLPEHAGARGDSVASVDADTLTGIAAAAATAVRRDAVARPHNAADVRHQFFEGAERLGKIITVGFDNRVLAFHDMQYAGLCEMEK
jgi:hypothetical protein